MNSRRFLVVLIVLSSLVIPITAFAQTSSPPTIAVLTYDPQPFIEAMSQLGYVAGQDVTYLTLSFEGVPVEQYLDSYTLQVQAMIEAGVDLFILNTDSEAVQMRQQTDTPIIFAMSDDPIATGAVTDMIAPGGATTGIVSNQHHPRRLQLLQEINPATSRVYYLYSSFALEGELILDQVRAVADQLGIEIIPAPVGDLESSLQALAAMPPDADWIFLTPYMPLFELPFIEALMNASIANQVPIAGFIAEATPGYAVNYGPDFSIIYRQVAEMTDRFLRGASPAETPILVAENGLVINLEVTESLGLDVPVSVLRQANLIVRPGDLATPPASGN